MKTKAQQRNRKSQQINRRYKEELKGNLGLKNTITKIKLINFHEKLHGLYSKMERAEGGNL